MKDWLQPAQRLKDLPPYVFASLDALKLKTKEEKGFELIDLGMGNPDGATPAPIVESASQALQDSRHHGYPPFEGTDSFRRAITDWYETRYKVKLDHKSEALPLIGSKEGLTHLALAFLNPGDLVLVPSPSYPAHFRGPLIAGAEVYEVILKPENNWLLDLKSIPEAVAKRAKVLFFNYPNNPTTAVASKEFFEEVVAFARKYEILLVHDMAYAELAFDGYQPTSLLEIPGGKDVGVEFHTLSKTYNMAGWRVGFVVGNSHVIQWLRTLKTNIDYGIFSAIQTAAETALRLPDSYLETVRNRYSDRRDFLIEGLGKLGWHIPKTSATMYLWIPCPSGIGSTDFALHVLQNTGVVMTPGNAFGKGGEGYVRISLIGDRDILGEALKRLEEANIRFKS
jgi:LL-diaminopimelate aminotransferase